MPESPLADNPFSSHASAMPPKTLADAMTGKPFSRNRRLMPKKDKIHPAMKQAEKAYMARVRGEFGKRP